MGRLLSKILFPKPWDIASFVSRGDRRPKGENMTDEEYEIIRDSWTKEPKKRLNMEDVISRLEAIQKK